MKFRLPPDLVFFRGSDAVNRSMAYANAGAGEAGARVSRPNARGGQVVDLTPKEMADLPQWWRARLQPLDDEARASVAGIPPAPEPNRPTVVRSLTEARASGGVLRDANTEVRL